MNIKGATSNSRGHTNAFHTDLEAGGLKVNYQNPEKLNLRRCLCCSKDHELAECEQFMSDEIQARWDIVSRTNCAMSVGNRVICEVGVNQESFVVVEVTGGITDCCIIPLD